MAEIVLGVGCSHSPLLTFPTEIWLDRARDEMRSSNLNLSDGRFISYEELKAERGEPYSQESQFAHLQAQYESSQTALEALSAALLASRPDVVVVVGDDHEELYRAGNTPSFAVFQADSLPMRDMSCSAQKAPNWLQMALSDYAMDSDRHIPGAADFSGQLIEKLMDAGVDVGVTTAVGDKEEQGLGHAFGFIFERLLKQVAIPMVPLLLNTYYPPNVVRPGRCIELGKKLKHAIEQIPGNQRVAVIASGGLSHFVTDEALDRRLLEAFKQGDIDSLGDLPMAALNAGSSEILCWLMAAAAFGDLTMSWSEYLPVYRTPAGSGIGMGFCLWQKQENI